MNRGNLTPVEWERVCAALTWLVRQEYPDTYSLAEIADIWGPGFSPEQIEALKVLEGHESFVRVGRL